MLCDRCKKNTATFHSTVNINGHITEKHLCEECAKKEGKLFNFNSFLSPNFSSLDLLDDFEELTCDKCGFSLSDFRQTGLLGCSHCYNVFRDIINENLLQIQPNNVHVGKKLNSDEGLSAVEKEIKKLELQLKQAVNEENYELAGELKKKIIALKEGEGNE